MTKRSLPRIGQTRYLGLCVSERDDLNGSRSCGLHQGQRACAPHQQAGHMTAPTTPVIFTQKHLAMRGPSTHEALKLSQIKVEPVDQKELLQRAPLPGD